MALRFGVFDHIEPVPGLGLDRIYRERHFVCCFQWGDLSHEQAMRSIELFATEIMPRYASATPAR